MKKREVVGFTLIELLVVIVIITALAGVALPVFSSNQTRCTQTKCLSNIKQVGLAIKLYAMDHDGKYPDQQLTGGKPNGRAVANSNQAFAQLIPTYFQTEAVFSVAAPKRSWSRAGDKWNPKVPDNKFDSTVLDARVETLKKGENAWAVMTGLNEHSDGRWPLIVNGTNGADTAFSVDEAAYGGVWKGTIAVILSNDYDAKIVNLDPKDHKIKLKPSGADMLAYSAADNWLTATSALVNPDK